MNNLSGDMDGPWKIVNPWMEQHFDDWEIDEIRFSRLYVEKFKHIHHNGHGAKIIIAKMADMLDAIHFRLAPLETPKLNAEIEKIMGHENE